MVGVPTSNRCDTCKKRKKKCDERRPQCTPCIRSGWKCPGYQTRWKFVDEAPRLEEHYAENTHVVDVVNSKDHENFFSTRRNERLEMLTTFSVPRYFGANPLGSAFVYSLDSNVAGKLFPLRLVGSFYQFIPARLGRNAALDDAIECICSIYSKALPAPHEISNDIYQSYAKAIGSLRTCLEDPDSRLESETLCASIILQFCELVVNADRGEWSRLLLGTLHLLQCRGIQRYSNEFDHAMLESQVGFIFGHSVRAREESFMSIPDWRRLLFDSQKWPFQKKQSPSLTSRTRLIGILIDLPTLINSAAIDSVLSGPKSDQKVHALITKFYQIDVEIKYWLEFEADPLLHTKHSGQMENSIQYPDLIAAINDCVSHKALLMISKALRILIQKISRSCQPPGLNCEDSFELTQKSLSLGYNHHEEIWRQRFVNALQFVQRECRFAAKPLEFGLRHTQSTGFIDESA